MKALYERTGMLDVSVQPHLLLEEPTREEQMRVALLVEYYGKSFHGSQFQPNQKTLQSELQEALSKLQLSASAVSFASRTDAGVNAFGQVAHFDIARDALRHIPSLGSALNAVLPETISVRDVHLDADFSFHSRREANCKWYRYAIYNSPNRSVWASRQSSTPFRTHLDASKMDQAAHLLLGLHDFTSFKDSDTDVTNNVCDILYAKVVRQDNLIIFDIVADRFLYKMVRNLAGQLIAIGQSEKALSPETMLNVLAERDRRKAAATAPAEGLMLMAIQYKSPFNFFTQDSTVRQLETMITQSKLESLQDENLFRKAS